MGGNDERTTSTSDSSRWARFDGDDDDRTCLDDDDDDDDDVWKSFDIILAPLGACAKIM